MLDDRSAFRDRGAWNRKRECGWIRYRGGEHGPRRTEERIMKRLVSLALVLVLAGGVLAQDNFGMYRMVDGEYSNFVMVDELTPGATLDLYITLHDPSVFVVGGFEVGIDMPEFTV